MITNTYDEIPYPSLVYTDTHPGRLATLATLFGLQQPPAVANCRILELGCGDGTNLIAIAQSLPQAECWGIDSSTRQIAQGQQLIEAISLTNVTLKQQDFQIIEASLGQFDYIIAHGVYSWVPKSMQDTVLSIIQRHLAINGIAYISYNIYPGWHLENVARDMMRYHTQQLPKLPFQINMMQAKGILQFLANLRQSGDNAFDLLLQEKIQQLQTMPDNYVYHDFLEPENHPVYFQQFIAHTTAHQLAYITDIEFRHYLMQSFPPQVIDAMEELFQDDFLKKEQYMDFFYNRTLRRSLLCHPDQQINREVDWQILPTCYIASTLSSENDFSLTPSTQLAIKYLTKIYPQHVSFTTLFQHVCQRLPSIQTDLSTFSNSFAQELLHLYYLEAIELLIEPPSFVTTISQYPTASPLARLQAEQQEQPLINLRCEFINLNTNAMALLPHLNGKNNSQVLRAILKKQLKKNQLANHKTSNLSVALEQALLEIARSALLIA